MTLLLRAAGGGSSFVLPAPADDLAIWRAGLASPPASFVILADSISAAYGVSEGQQWPNLVDASFGATADRWNYAQPGAPSSYFLGGAHYNLSITLPDLVILELGVNDMAASVSKATYKANIETIIADVRGAMVVDPSFLLLVAYDIGDPYPIAWSEYADAMAEIAAADDDVAIYDLRPAFGSPTTALLQSDLVHPNPTGHVLIADLLFAYLS